MPKPTEEQKVVRDPELKTKWLAALRSGEWIQAEGRLRFGRIKRCCLGVLCEVAGKDWDGFAGDGTGSKLRECRGLPSTLEKEFFKDCYNYNGGGPEVRYQMTDYC